ncbi:triple tyrosine motif-containing protein [Zhouia sp. PK063]|uniref:helix-turn-helix and ligand-binding sensor domain-containing protein n=1 Tax=Zhouia sp. PK063 TaxID=3373602 RepID=UPI0037AB6FF1
MKKNKIFYIKKILLFIAIIYNYQPIFCQISNGYKTDFSLNSYPIVHNFSKNEYQSDSQFWTACEDDHDIVYFGNNDGVLIYNGEQWQKVVLPNSSSVRALSFANNQVYVGGYNEIGTVQADSLGDYHYKSLIGDYDLKGKNLENVWQINQLDKTIIFRFFKELISVTNNKVTRIPATSTFIYANVVHNTYYVQDNGNGILSYQPTTGELNLVFKNQDLNYESVVGIEPLKNKSNEVLIITKNGSIYKGNLNRKTVSKIKDIFSGDNPDQIISVTQRNDELLLGTLSSKIKILNGTGTTVYTPEWIQRLQDDTVLNLYNSKNGVWAMLNNGIDFINFNPYVTKIFNEGSVYDIAFYKGKMFLSTNKGLRMAEKSISANITYKTFDELKGQTWFFSNINNTLFVGHDKGLFYFDDNLSPKKIGDVSGIWKIIAIPSKKNEYLACGYNGIYLIKKTDNTYQIINKIEGFNESSRDIMPAKEPNTYWVCHGYKGIFHIKIDNDYTRVYAIDHYTNQNGLKSPFNINVYNWKNNTVFTTNNGIFTFDASKNRFKPFKPLNSILDTTKNTRKILVRNDTTWVVQDDEIGYFIGDSSTAQLHKDLFLNIKGKLNRGVEAIVPLPNFKTIIGTTEGAYIYNLKNNKKDNSSTTLISKITLNDGKETKLLPLANDSNPELPTKSELIRFDFAAPQLNTTYNTQFQYVLKDVDAQWSNWSAINFKEYSHLRPGKYTFKVRARDLKGNIAKTASYQFIIAPEWYRNTFFKILYFFLFIAIMITIYYFTKKHIEKKNYKHQQEARRTQKLLQLEIDQLKLKQDKEKIQQDKITLEQDVLNKSKELANYTMQLINKKDIFNELEIDLKELRDLIKNPTSKGKLREIFRKLQQHKIGEEYMEVFDVNFEKIHHQFFEQLKEIYPKISKKELRLCAFIKMDLSNKEIAPLLNISIRGVETARYRVRKKLDLEHDTGLQEFLKEL